MTKEFYTHPRSNRIMRLFWKAAGADRFILERSTYNDQIKYLCLGGIIIATGLMAGLAGGYAFYTIFEPKGSALDSFKTVNNISGAYDAIDIPTAIKAWFFGIIWGLIIFNIDRFIVSSTGKGDGTEAITKKEFVGALPRMIMGAIIAMTISQPVEIRMFKTEIDVQLHEKQIEQQQQYNASIDSTYDDAIAKKELEILKFEAQLDTLRNMYSNLERQYIDEARIVTVGPRAMAVKAQMQSDSLQIAALENNPDYLRLKSERQDLEKEKANRKNQGAKVAAGLDGLLERIKISHEIAGWLISTFITLLFLAIELTPIFFKLMLTKSPYDYLEENIKELIKADAGIEVKYNYYQDRQGMERDLVVHHDVIRLLKEKIKQLEAQGDLSVAAIESWKENKIKDVKENPTDYINEDKNE